MPYLIVIASLIASANVGPHDRGAVANNWAINIYAGEAKRRPYDQHVRQYSWMNQIARPQLGSNSSSWEAAAKSNGDVGALYPQWFPPSGNYTEETPRSPYTGGPKQRCSILRMSPNWATLMFRAISEQGWSEKRLLLDTAFGRSMNAQEVRQVVELGGYLGTSRCPSYIVNVWAGVDDMKAMAAAGWIVMKETPRFDQPPENIQFGMDQVKRLCREMPPGKLILFPRVTKDWRTDPRGFREQVGAIVSEVKKYGQMICARLPDDTECPAEEMEKLFPD